MALNTTTATIGSGCNTATASPSLVQWDRGQILQIEGLTLPETYQVEFSGGGTVQTVPVIGTPSGVEIPNALLQSSHPITAYIVLHEGEDDRETEYWITIYVKPRQAPQTTDPDPEQADVIDQAIAALNAASSSVSQYKADMVRNAGNVLEEIGTFNEHPSPQLTFSWSNGNTQAHISGTTTYQNTIGIYSTEDSDGLTPPLEAGTEYELVFGADTDLIKAFLWIGSTEQALTGNTRFTIPDASTYFEIGIVVEAGTIDNNVVFGIPYPTSHLGLEEEIDALRMDPISDATINALFS